MEVLADFGDVGRFARPKKGLAKGENPGNEEKERRLAPGQASPWRRVYRCLSVTARGGVGFHPTDLSSRCMMFLEKGQVRR
jgi:hypothetical protein